MEILALVLYQFLILTFWHIYQIVETPTTLKITQKRRVVDSFLFNHPWIYDRGRVESLPEWLKGAETRKSVPTPTVGVAIQPPSTTNKSRNVATNA